MKSTFVFATANSRLHADIMAIRLRRAGIEIERVSATFARRFAPNSFSVWLRNPRALRLRSPNEPFVAVGPLSRLFGGRDPATIPVILYRLGLGRADANRLGQSLLQGHALLGVEARNEEEAAIAWHVFHHAGAENLAISELPFAATKMTASGQPWSSPLAA